MSEERPNIEIWKSHVWHNSKCWFVSTIERTYDTAVGSLRGKETIVWEYDWDKAERGAMVIQAGGVRDHQEICLALINEGKWEVAE
jgi:molybdopterin synthase catalytic subunit